METLIFTLTTSAGSFTLHPSPDGWDQSMITWARSLKYSGAFRSFTIPMKFVKNGARELRREFYTYGAKGTAQMTIKRIDNITMIYSVAYTGKADFSTFKDNPDFVEVNLTDDGIAKAVKDNGQTEYTFDYSDPFIGGGTFTNYFTDGYINLGSKTYECWDLADLARALLNRMTGGKLQAGEVAFRSDILQQYSIADYDPGVNPYPVCITTGLSLRHDENNRPSSYRHTLKTTFEDFFQSIMTVMGVGMGVEVINGIETMRIEPRSYFFDTSTDPVIIGPAKDITISLDAELAINRVKVGYEAKEYKNASTNSEFNVTSSWSLPNDTSTNELDLISKYRADARGIAECIAEGATGNDTADNDIFFIEVLLWPGTPDYWTLKTGSLARATSAIATTWEAKNAGLSPRNCLSVNQYYIDCLTWNFTGDEIEFTSGDNQLSDLEVKKYSGGSWVKEYDPLQMSFPTLFLPVIIEVECPLPYDLIDSLNTNSARKVVFTYEGITYTGWIMEIKANLSGRGSHRAKLLSTPGNSFGAFIR